MTRRIQFAWLLAVLALGMIATPTVWAREPQALQYLPKRGLPTKAETVFRVDLDQLTGKKVNALLDAIGKAVPKESADGHKMLDDFRKKALPGILKARDILHKAGIEQIVLPGETKPADDPNEAMKEAMAETMAENGPEGFSSDANDPTDSDLEFVLLKVRKGTTPADAKKAFLQAAAEGIKTAKPYLKEMQGNAKSGGNGLTIESPTDELSKNIAELEKHLKEMTFGKWEDGWVLVSTKGAEPNDPLPGGTKGLKALNAALARSGNAPIAMGYRLTEKAKAKMIKSGMNNPMFGELNAAAAQMNWSAGWLEMKDDPRIVAVVSFPARKDAMSFHGGVTKMIMFVGGLMAMGGNAEEDPDEAASTAALQGLLADIAPAQSDKEVQFTVTTAALRKMLLLHALQQKGDDGQDQDNW